MCSKKFRGVTWYAHNLSYDTGVLFKYLPANFKLLFLNGKVLQGRLYPQKKQTHYWADSWRMFAAISLKSLGDNIGLPKYQTPSHLLPPEITEQKEYQETHEKDIDIELYLQRDVEIVNKGMELLQNEVNRLGGNMKLTLPSTAMDLFRRAYLHEEFKTPFPFYNEVARQAYFGGRVEPFQLGEMSNVNVYDINSLYPYVMHEGIYPDPNYLKYTSTNCSLHYIMKYEGVSNVTIYIPKTHIPILPYRFNNRLYFPTGEFKGTYTHLELREVLKRGAKIKHIHYSLYSLRTTNPFKSYVSDLYKLRLQYKANNDPRQLIIKLLLNSFYGKFGERLDAGLTELGSTSLFESKKDLTGYEPIVFDNTVYLRHEVPKREQPDYTNTLWASYVTAYARLTLFSYMEQLETTMIYCDTDSVFTTKTLETGKELGMMKLEHENVDVNIIGAKMYQIYHPNEKTSTKVRGVPNLYQAQFLSSHEATFLKSLGFFEAARRGLNPSEWVEITKHHCSQTPKRFYQDSPLDQKKHLFSRPLTIDEVHFQDTSSAYAPI